MHVPLVPCDEKGCQWYIYDGGYNNCFWILSNALLEYPREMEIEEIADIENTTVEEIEKIIEESLTKLRNCVRKKLGDF